MHRQTLRKVSRKIAGKTIIGSYVRNFIFGIEDSLVSTVGMISGIAAADTPKSQIVLSGIVLIVVEAFSMGVGSFLSEQSEEEYLNHKEGPVSVGLISGIIMFASYIIAGIVPLGPYFIWHKDLAFWYSIIASIMALAVLGSVSGIFFKVSVARNMLKMSLLGGFAIMVGIFVGQLISAKPTILLQ